MRFEQKNTCWILDQMGWAMVDSSSKADSLQIFLSDSNQFIVTKKKFPSRVITFMSIHLQTKLNS